jgi:phage replication initiation protein
MMGEKKSCTDGVSNTRPERTEKETTKPLRVLVDWLQVTFNLDMTFHEVQAYLGLENQTFTYFDYGRDTFTEMMRFGNITIMRKGTSTYRLVLTGQGCREYETLSRYSWIDLISVLKDCLGCRFTRIDIAIDDFEKAYNVDMIRQCTNDGAIVTRLSEWTDKKKGLIATGELTMDSFYLGSMESRISINFYDKKLERENFGNKSLHVTVDSWTRTELRCKREYADDVTNMMLLNEEQLGLIALTILNKYVRFIELTGDSNKRREPMLKWWSDFIGNVGKLKFSLQAPDKTVERIMNWHVKSVAPSIATLYQAFPNAHEFYDYIQMLVEVGKERMTDEHEMMVDQYKELRFAEVRNKRAKSGTGENDDAIQHNEISLNRLYEFTGKDKNREIKKTYTCDRIGMVRPIFKAKVN